MRAATGQAATGAKAAHLSFSIFCLIWNPRAKRARPLLGSVAPVANVSSPFTIRRACTRNTRWEWQHCMSGDQEAGRRPVGDGGGRARVLGSGPSGEAGAARDRRFLAEYRREYLLKRAKMLEA